MKQRLIFPAIVGVIAIGFIILGAFLGEVNTVFTKAINICLECIGIG